MAALVVASAPGVTFFFAGDLSGSVEPQDADYLWRPWRFLDEHGIAVGVVSVVVFVVAGWALASERRAGRVPAPLVAQIIILTLFSAWIGLGYRVVTAGVIGANIGGGLVMLLTPVLALVSAAAVAGLAIQAWRRADRPPQPGDP